jgi:D-tyrosyl-tRNA(Tyr) deacylase
MRAVVQRVSEAEVSVGGEIVGAIGEGLLTLVGVTHGDTTADAEALARKLATLRIFRDERGFMNRSVVEVEGAVLVVSQFTLYGSTGKGRRPSFTEAAAPEEAEVLVDALVEDLAAEGLSVATGRFGAMMQVRLVNDGPVTFVIESRGGSVIG